MSGQEENAPFTEPTAYNYPEPKATNKPFEQPDEPKNPVVRGLPLYYGASLISSLGIVQEFLWKNTGFGRLRDSSELNDVEPRYNPTVIPVPSTNASNSQPATPADAPRVPAADADGRFYTVYDYHEAYKTGKVTPTRVAEVLLPLIRRDVEKPSEHSKAWLDVRPDLILAAAAASTQRYKEGKPLGLLDGVPVTVKDEVDLAGHRKSIGTTHDYTNKEGATSFCVTQWEEEGAVILGKSSMHELGLDTTNNNPNHGTPLNPYNSHYYTGGSSGGSGYAVGSGLIPLALGADGGGSIRIPSQYCGIFGIKTSHGRVSLRPTSSLAKSTGVIGPMAANMADLEIGYRTLAQPDRLNPTSARFPPPPTSINLRASRPKVLGICKPWFDRADAPVKERCKAALDHLVQTQGYSVIDISLPNLAAGQSAHALTILAEIGSGTPSLAGLTAPNKILLSVGAHASGIDFLAAQKLRNLLMQHLAHLYRAHPGLLVVTPTTPNAGWHISGGAADLAYGVSDGNRSIRSMEYVWLANFTGCPAIQAPVGYADPAEGDGPVPVGLMAMGEWGDEETCIAFGYDVEAWLNGGLKGGRRRPDKWVDVLALAVEKMASAEGEGDGEVSGKL
ncbi:amidase signature domain-containing protein [Phyllosticta citribraziliensis]|uniref:Amidase signature domain-containing protein n=1 Tax=Phyllosticta citribraziliensis TaxID=989973 RepID=A0ABR1M4D2_9PEZI